MRNPEDLGVFQLADSLVLSVYRLIAGFPADERFALGQQLRRAAVSVASNIVEGCTRDSQVEFARFIEIATGSAAEVRYQVGLAGRLGHGNHAAQVEALRQAESTVKALIAFRKALRTQTPNPKP